MGVGCFLWIHKIGEDCCGEYCGLYWILSLIIWLFALPSYWLVLFSSFSFVDSVTLYIRCTLIFPKSLKRADLLAIMSCLHRY